MILCSYLSSTFFFSSCEIQIPFSRRLFILVCLDPSLSDFICTHVFQLLFPLPSPCSSFVLPVKLERFLFMKHHDIELFMLLLFLFSSFSFFLYCLDQNFLAARTICSSVLSTAGMYPLSSRPNFVLKLRHSSMGCLGEELLESAAIRTIFLYTWIHMDIFRTRFQTWGQFSFSLNCLHLV